MVRILISLPEKDLKRLDRLAKQSKRSRADLVRQGVVDLIKKESDKPTWKEIVARCAGMWKDRNIDSVEYVRALRSEWDRDWDKKQ